VPDYCQLNKNAHFSPPAFTIHQEAAANLPTISNIMSLLARSVSLAAPNTATMFQNSTSLWRFNVDFLLENESSFSVGQGRHSSTG
jgi:hypothetical protein